MLGTLFILTGKVLFDLRVPKAVSDSIDIVIGILLVVVGIIEILKKRKKKPKKVKPQDVSGSKSPKLFKIAVLGGFLSVFNASSIIFYLAAAKRTSDTNFDIFEKIAAMSLVELLSLLPIIVPLLITIIAPSTSMRILDRINEVIIKNGAYLIIFVALGFGVFLIGKGVLGLV